MNDIVPGALQRLREADIVGLAGLAGASLGQEYCRSGYISTTRRQHARLSGRVTIYDMSSQFESTWTPLEQSREQGAQPGTLAVPMQHYEVTAEVMDRAGCQVICSCGNQATLICAHAAALLYQWINRPYTFELIPSASEGASTSSNPAPSNTMQTEEQAHQLSTSTTTSTSAAARYAPLLIRRSLVNTVGETLAQLGLSELRATAREYGIVINGLGKQQLLETMIETLSQPEAVRRVVSTLEKAQRQLLAAFALVGGSVNDDDLRGLFERFSLGNASALQEMLVVLQTRLLIVRTSVNHSLQQRFNTNPAVLDVNWYIPQEIHEALHVALPVTPFDIEVPYRKGSQTALPVVKLAESHSLLADMLLAARALDGSPAEQDKRVTRVSSLTPGRQPADGSLALPPPEDQPSQMMLETLQTALPRSPAFHRFVIRLLRQANILYKEDNWLAHLRALPNASHLLLGPKAYDALHELFTNWLNQSSYAELFDLAESGVRVRCRATPLNQPALRRGELDLENSEARQELSGLLAQVPVGEWVNFSAFARFIYRLRPTFLQQRQRLFPAPHWWIEQDEGRPLHPTQLADWLRAEGRYVAQLIQGPLHWWGICDLALATDGQLLSFRLTSLAHLFFQGLLPDIFEEKSQLDEQVMPVFHVSQQGHLLLPCQAANWPLIACIEDFAESTGVEHEQLSYQLTPHSLGEAINQGRDPHTLLALLEASAHSTQDPALRQLLDRLERRIAQYGRVRLYTDVSLVQVADAAVMQQLTAITSLDEQTIRALHPTLLLLKNQGAERLLDELKRRGQAPLLHEEA